LAAQGIGRFGFEGDQPQMAKQDYLPARESELLAWFNSCQRIRRSAEGR
jgi:hypothetical protein